jgi:histidinol-phosphate/aromatic aminotransferase/cobyric acid decarboxylase-like protein
MGRRKLFQRNDIDQVYYTFFQDIWDSGDIYADPSGWHDTESQAAGLLPKILLNENALGRYYLDEGNTLGDLKDHILQLLEFWEKRHVDKEEMTLYSSVSTATAAILIALKRLGAKTVLFETPAYGVTVNQARYSGYKIVLIPTYHRDNFALTVEPHLLKNSHPVVLWLTQPRMSLGFDQEESFIETLLDKISVSDFLVVDEATEQRYPSVLSRFFGKVRSRQVLRIRGLLKPLGLNGLRLACVLHSSSLRSSLENTQEVLGASLDLYSLQMAAELAQKKDIFSTMLSVANTQVTALRRKAELLALGSGITVSRLVNGYMGSVFIPFKGRKENYNKYRRELLNYCRSRRMPVILGSSMFFAFDPEWEQIRLNYFSREHHILRAMEVLTGFIPRISQ